MFKNYLVSALNNLLKSRLYSLINITGLAVGLAASILIALYVLDELSYDKQWRHADSIYRVNQSTNANGRGFTRSPASTLLALPALRQYFPEAIEDGTRLLAFDSDIESGTLKFHEGVVRVDPAFTEVFDVDVLAGSLTSTLADPGNIALSSTVAESYFGISEEFDALLGNVLTVTFNGVVRDYRISAVYRVPGNSILDLPTLIQLDVSVLPPLLGNWGARVLETYIKLRPGVAPGRISAGLAGFVNQVVDPGSFSAGPDVRPSDRLRFDLQAITGAHLNSPFDESRAGGNRTVVIAFSAIAALVLLIGTINYTILSTARAAQRAREVAMRKTAGATKLQLITQFLGESFCLVLPAMIFSFVLVELQMPVFEAMLGKSLNVNWTSPQTWGYLLSLYVAVSLLGGLYPAFILSHFRPGNLLSAGPSESQGARNLRDGLVIFQFGISIALIIATGAIYAQVWYATNRDHGFASENILVIENFLTRQAINANKVTLKQEVLALNNVISASLSTHQPTQKLGMANVSLSVNHVGNESSVYDPRILGVDYDFFALYETPIIAGRGFDDQLDQEAEIFPQQPGLPAPTKVLLNESAVRLLGFANAEAALNRQLQVPDLLSGGKFTVSIIGVAADTNFFNLNSPPRPELYFLSPGFTDVLSVKFRGSQQALMAQIESAWADVMGEEELFISLVSQNMAAEFTQEKTEAKMLITFSCLAIVIACLGLYGSSTFSIERRTKEIGIRKVMGAEVREIVTLLMWQFSKPVLIANVLAWPAALWAMLIWLQQFPYQIDAVILLPLCVLAGFIALSIAWLTVAGNTVKVATTNPVYALRYE